MKKIVLLFVALLMLLYLSAYAPTAPFPKMINYQGMLTTLGGSPVPNGDYSIRFRIYTASVGGTTLWDKTKSVSVQNGLFNVKLGESTPINLPFNALYWLGIKVGGDAELSPRTQLTAVGYAYRALVADTAYVAAPGSDMDARYVNSTQKDSIRASVSSGFVFRVTNTGSNDGIGISVPGSGGDGITIDTAGNTGIEIFNTGYFGMEINGTKDDAIHIMDAGDFGIYMYNSADDGIYIGSPGDYGMYVYNSADDGINIYSPGGEGVLVYNAQGRASFNADRPDTHGVYIYRAGRDGVYIDSTYRDGIYMNDCGDDGIHVQWADDKGVLVSGAGLFGIDAKGNYGNTLRSNNSSYYGLEVRSYAAFSANLGLKVYGTFTATGSKSSAIQTSQGEEHLYAIETPDVEFMASGSASLANGQAQITFERLFQEAISADVPIKVIVTPASECNGIYVSSRSSTGFTVKELMSGTSNAEFDWMAIGRRKGYEQRPVVQVADIEEMEALDQEEFETQEVYYPNNNPPPEEEIEKEEVEQEEIEEQ